jgi:putative heme-binding domain-containing protein
LKKDKDAEVKVAALKALASIPNDVMEQAIKTALTAQDKDVRVAGIELIAQLNIPQPLMVGLLSDVIKTKTIEEKQEAILTLGTLPLDNTKKVFDSLLTQMANGKLSHDVYFELGEAIDSTHSSELAGRYQSISKQFSKDELTASFAGALYGGNERKGRTIFFQNQTAQCIRCHSYNDIGGNAGPPLDGIASKLPREKLLEALINPSARIAPGFGVVTLQMKDGKMINGIVQNETEKTITIKSGDHQPETIAKEQVGKRIDGASSMPEMRYMLTKKEIRDVVSFLSTLK